MKSNKLKEYLAPMVEVYAVTLEKGFAISEKEELRGATEGKQDSTSIGRYKDGVNWSGHDWNE